MARAGDGHGGGELRASRSFADLSNEWLSDLDLRELGDGTKQLYRVTRGSTCCPPSSTFDLAEIPTGRVEWSLRPQAALLAGARLAVAPPAQPDLHLRAAPRRDARNAVEGTSPLRGEGRAQCLTLEQVAAIRRAAATWRTGPGLPGGKG